MMMPPKVEVAVDVVIEPDEGGYHAYTPGLKGLHVDGATEEEALRNAREAIVIYLESLVRHGEPIPVGPDLHIRKRIPIPRKALLRSVRLPCPSLSASGIR